MDRCRYTYWKINENDKCIETEKATEKDVDMEDMKVNEQDIGINVEQLNRESKWTSYMRSICESERKDIGIDNDVLTKSQIHKKLESTRNNILY